MTLVLAALLSLGGSALAAAVLARRRSLALSVAAGGCTLAALLGTASAFAQLLGAPAAHLTWSTPLGAQGALTLDPLAAWFLIPVFVVGAACAAYGRAYLLAGERPVGMQAAGLNLIILVIALVVLAGDALTFLMAWELMTVLSFLLVTHEHEQKEVRSAGLLYLVLTHAGTTCLLALFATLASSSGTMLFSGMHAPVDRRGAWFALAALGFGVKAGAWPLHVWLPVAHPVAPSHISAILSGIVIKMGIYGLLRAAMLLGPLPASCGAWLIAAGVASATLGVLSALAQHELKRLLAYHSIENIGIILMGAGVGLTALSLQKPAVAALGFAGALLHVTNHALFKSLLFLAAGAVKKACGTLQLDRLGGLIRTMPRTALAFVVGAAAISGLPPLNGFASELLVYLSLLGAFGLPPPFQAGAVIALAALACVGALAAACFAKATFAVFLGTPRTPIDAPEAPREMLVPMAVLGAACVAIGLSGPLLLAVLDRPVAQLAGVPLSLAAPSAALAVAAALGAALIATAALLWLLRRLLLARRAPAAAPTWSCGYPAVVPSMQYTAASFAQPLLTVFRRVLLPQRQARLPAGPFPAVIAVDEHCTDPVDRLLLAPALHATAAGFTFVRRAQPTRVQGYVLAVFAALVVLLLWRVG